MIIRSSASFAAALVLTGAAPLALAEDIKPAPAAAGGERLQISPEERVKQLKERLSLTDEQTAKITAIYEKSAEKVKSLRGETTLPQPERRQKFIEVLRETATEVDLILTPEQQTKWKAVQEERRAEMRKLLIGGEEAKPK